MVELPTGTITFLFTDIEGSTKLLQRLGDAYPAVLEQHARLLREALAAHGGTEVSTEGDAFFCVFRSAPEAMAASITAQRALLHHTWPDDCAVKVRMGLHTGEGVLGGDNYVGLDVHRAARVASSAWGGQVVVTEATRGLVAPSLPPGVSLRDLGEHRLKDLLASEHLYQLVADGLPSEFPQLRTLSAVRHNLPVQLTSFIGRDKDVAEARAALQSARLLTLTGPGGTGKTRLSLQAAAEVVGDFADGVFFVPLASISDPELVASAIVQSLTLADSPDPPLRRVLTQLADKHLLLVLDNFEQVAAAGPQVAEILRAAPGVKVLVTSRVPLHVSGEHELPVSPLPFPDPQHPPPLDEMASYPAAALFVERARSVRPNFQLTESNAPAIAEIAARLDGLPLAIELAAARAKLLTPQAMLEHLGKRLTLLAGGSHDLPARQRTLRNAISWSYDLLEPPAQEFMARLAVFVGGGGLAQITAVAQDDGDSLAALDALGILLDQSLLRPDGEGRFVMLETIREFALEKLEGGVEAARQRHLDAFVALAEEAAPHLTSLDQAVWLNRLAAEHDNLRAALEFATESGHAEEAGRIAFALWRFWQMRGHLHEARRRLEAVMAMPGMTPTCRVNALEAAGGVCYWMGDLEGARLRYGEALAIQRELGDPAGIAHAAYNLAFPQGFEGDLATSTALFDEAADIYRQLGDRLGLARVLFGRGSVADTVGDAQSARAFYLEGLEGLQGSNDSFTIGWSERMLGRNFLHGGDLEQARRHLEESFRIFAKAGDVSAVVLHLVDFAQLAIRENDPERAVKLAGAMSSLEQQSGIGLTRIALNRMPDLKQQVIESLGPERSERLLAEGAAMSLDQVIEYTLEAPSRS